MMTTLPTLRQFRHLVALAEHKHFSKAAAASHVTQSTLSASLKELEEILGVALVDRTKRSVVFTPFGEDTVRRAQQILDEAEDLARAAHTAGEPLSGTVRMGVIPTISPFLLPPVLKVLRTDYPNLRLYLREDLTDHLIERLQAGELDVVLLALPYDLGTLESEVLFDDPFSFCCRTDHPLANAARVSGDRLTGESLLLLQDGHCLRDHALAACRLRNKEMQVDPFEATSLLTLAQMVDNGLGTTLVPQLAIDAGLLNGTSLMTIPLDDSAAKRQIGLAWRARTGRRDEFRLLGREIRRLVAKKETSVAA
ncbi:MAG TPA: hydrogen peroxide-inducible genes activator [Magnetospirillaceae bacterium]|jgi:LysR family hydrogen peroxide-inducible transcriptional activator